MRLALLGQTGGLFSDTDTVCMKDLTSLTNFVGRVTKKFINNAIFHFHRGNPILQKNLQRQNEFFGIEERGVNGLVVMTNVIKEACNFTFADERGDSVVQRCQDVLLMPSKAFYPIPLKRSGDIFTENLGENLMKEISSSYIVHMWSGVSALSPVRIGSHSLYDTLAASFCPSTRDAANSTEGAIRYYGEALPGRAWHGGIGRP
ncbi:lactosylceramide 4-alpha-galactosyltransferase-like [Macrobrachium rosenbergii]|uniref:lactosylceramide 4-alpha-galactosyltransferase-like n=1 Tax=Macrobrachium rosenbergii TaxID=79674 RepID=UPI0034D56C9A